MFVGMHLVLANITEHPEIAISPEEGKQFMASAQNVMQHYSVQSTQKTLDWIAFAGCCMSIYAPRIVAIQMNAKAKGPQRGAAQPIAPDPMAQFHPSVPPGDYSDI